MIALILNSGMGRRMGSLTTDHPKCMTEITEGDTIISRQLRLLEECGVGKALITTGPFADALEDYVRSLGLAIDISFVNNPIYDKTNYIYSIFSAREYLDDDIILMHGDLVFEKSVLEMALDQKTSCVTVSSTLPLPEKDFKAVIRYGMVKAVGVEFFDDALACQPLYCLKRKDWNIWLDSIVSFCEEGKTNCYAEKALNLVTDRAEICPADVKDLLCGEIDNEDDYKAMLKRLKDSSYD